MYGPISDVIPSTPVFEMYPIGFSSLVEYLAQRGYRTRILNIAYRMLQDKSYDVEKAITPNTTLISIMQANNEIGTI